MRRLLFVEVSTERRTTERAAIGMHGLVDPVVDWRTYRGRRVMGC
jgi:hypothetical protein